VADVSPTGPMLAGRRFLVTGARGFLGTHLCRRLRYLQAEVHAVSRTERPPDNDGLHWWHNRLHNQNDIAHLLDQTAPDVVVHLSGHVTANPRLDTVQSTFQSLLADTVSLLTSVATSGCERLVLVGSLTEPGPGAEDVVPGSPYVAAKWAASGYGRMFHALYDTPVVIARPGMAYGPGQSPDKVIPHVILTLLDGAPPRLTSGKLLADWIYIEDVVEGLMRAILQPGLDGQSVDLGTGTLTSVRDVVQEVVRMMDTPVQPIFDAIPDRPKEYVRPADTDAMQKRLGWLPQTTLSEGLARTIVWYRAKAGQ